MKNTYSLITKNTISTLIFGSIFLFSLLLGCNKKENSHEEADSSMDSTESQSAKETENTEWTYLFNGENTDQWRKVYEEDFPEEGWVVKDSMLTVLQSNGLQGGKTGSIVTKNQYSNFELQLDFKLTKAANSGIKYFVVEDSDFFEDDPAGRGIGLEYQILDDKNHPDAHNGVNGNRTVASLYDLIPAAKDKKVNPAGEWNHVRLISNGHHVEHWLNGKKVLEYERGSDSFRALVDKSKYSDYEGFGLAEKGHILLQNHGNKVSFKNIKIKELD